MPTPIEPNTEHKDNSVKFKCTIKTMFKGCPKDNGWFGCYAHITHEDRDVKLTGITNIALVKGMMLSVRAVPNKTEAERYDVIEMKVLTKTTRGITAYLSSIRGVSKNTAQTIVSVFGKDTIDMLKNHPEEVKDATGITDKQIKAIVEGINNADVFNILRSEFPELSSILVTRIYQVYKYKDIDGVVGDIDAIVEKIKDNPYELTDIAGVTFPIADAIAVRLGTDPTAPFRVNHGLVHLLENYSSGDLYINLSDNRQLNNLWIQLENTLKIRLKDINDFSNRLINFSLIPHSPIVIEPYNQQAHLYLRSTYNNMMLVIDTIQRLNKPAPHPELNAKQFALRYTTSKGFHLNKEQKQAVETAVNNGVSIITGGPGRGKTSIIDCVASCWLSDKTNGHQVTLLAPTGKAMNKLKTETNGKYKAMTIDKLIADMEHKNNMSFENSKKHMLIIDESSMIDVEKIAKLFMIAGNCTFCFVGDIDQLPPISPGAFLKELIESNKVPTTRLITAVRNGGLVLSNAEKINNNDTNLQYDLYQMPFFPQAADDDAAIQFILSQYVDEMQNCQDETQLALLSPTRKGILGTVNINMQIQNLMCPENELAQPTFSAIHKALYYNDKGYPIQSTIYGNGTTYTRFRIGDIVMNTKNITTKAVVEYSNNDYWNGHPVQFEAGIFNGDCGRIIGYMDSLHNVGRTNGNEIIVIQLFNGKIVEIDLTAGEFEHFELGYAMTVHKSQGCEYKTVIYISPHNMLNLIPFGFGNKNLVYTAVTRARERVVIIGSKEALNACISKTIDTRNSTLSARF